MTNKKNISDEEFVKTAKGIDSDVIETLERKHEKTSKEIQTGTGVGDSSQVIGGKRKSPAELIAEVELEEKQAEKDGKTISIVRDEFGKVKFEIEETKNDLGLTEGDVKFLKENPDLLKEIFSIIAGKDTKAKAKETSLQESVDIEDIFEGNFEESTVYPNQNLIKNVAVIGKISKNGREYSEEALEQIAEFSNGVRVFADHKKGQERSIREIIGILKNARKEESKVKADLEVLKSQNWIMDIAQQAPHTVGFSIVGKGKIESDTTGKNIVREVVQLLSADIVLFPATTKGLFENEKKFKEDEDPCPYYRTKNCVVTSFGDDADKCKFTNRNCPFK